MTIAGAPGRHWARRHPVVLFWALTTPLVFQLTYALMDPTTVVSSTAAVWATFLLAQLGYLLLVVALLRLRRGYWNWVGRL